MSVLRSVRATPLLWMLDCLRCCWEHTLQKSTPKDVWHCLQNFAASWDRAW